MNPRGHIPVLNSSQKIAWAMILFAAAAVRLYQLGEQPVWCDEALFWQRGNHPGWLRTLLHTIADDVYPPLFFLLVHLIGFFSIDEFWIRLPMALFGIASVAVLMDLIRRVFDARMALYAGLLAALSPVLVYYSQELKMYSMLYLFLLLLFREAVLCIEDPQRGWKKLALWATLSVYTFYLALLPWVVILGLAWWKNRSDWRKAMNVWKGFAVAGLCFLPWFPFFIKSILVNQGSAYNFHFEKLLLFSFQNFSIGFWSSEQLTWTAFAAFASMAFLALARHDGNSRQLRLFAAFSLLPLAISWAVSVAKPIYSDRAMLVCAFAWLALVAAGLARLPRPYGLTGLLLLASLNLLALKSYYFDPSSQRVNYRPAWNHMISEWKPGDSIFHVDIFSYYPFRFFSQQEARNPKTSRFKDEEGAALFEGSARIAGQRPNWINSEPVPFAANKGAGYIRQQWRRINAWLTERGMGLYTSYNRDFVGGDRLNSEALPGVRRIWYINTDKEASARVWMPHMNVYRDRAIRGEDFDPDGKVWLKKDFRLVGKWRVNEVDLFLFEKKASSKVGKE